MPLFKPVLAWLSKAMYQPLWSPAPVRSYKPGASKPRIANLQTQIFDDHHLENDNV